MTTILYSPMNPDLADIMQKTAQKLNLEATGMPSAESMNFFLQNEMNLIQTVGGIQFNDSLSGSVPLPKDLYAAIRFPGELRSLGVNPLVPASWRTNFVFPRIQYAGPRDPTFIYTATPSKQNGCLIITLG